MSNAGNYKVEHHGSSGKWYPCNGEFKTIEHVIARCRVIKGEGYGVRAFAPDGTLVINAPWQEDIDVSLFYYRKLDPSTYRDMPYGC